MSRSKKQFCLREHDTFVIGRTNHGMCSQCRIDSNKFTPQRKERNWRLIGYKNKSNQPFTFNDFDYLYQIQQGCCKICKRHSSILKRSLCIDHNHKTGIVRGLLCFDCNSKLGAYEKWVKVNLISIEEYLTKGE